MPDSRKTGRQRELDRMRDIDDLDFSHGGGILCQRRADGCGAGGARQVLRRLAGSLGPAHHGRPDTPMSFKDHFSRQAAAYSRYRPDYPPELIDWVSSLAPDRRLAVDCATGNGQAALSLASRFDLVIALDGSLAQLRRATSRPNLAYVAALAERQPIRNHSASLVTAAQAAHWFDFGRFYAECRRVLAPGGVVAAWTYGKFRLDEANSGVPEAVDAVIDDFYENVVGAFWSPERRYVELGYQTLPFPWREVTSPEFALETAWDLETVLGYLASWSAVQRYRDHHGRDPLQPLRAALVPAWGGAGIRRLRWPVHVRVGFA